MARLPRSALARGAVFVVTVLVVVAGVSVGPYLSGGQITVAEHPEYATSKLLPEKPASRGRISVDRARKSGVVLIDMAHSNRFETDEIQPLTSAITAAGYRVDFLTDGDDFEKSLDRADAFVVIDPGSRYSRSEIGHIEEFVEKNGRLVMLGEPTTSKIKQTGFVAALVPQRNKLTPLASAFGIDFGEGYLYNMARNDGNYQNVYARSNGSSPILRGVQRTAMFTAASVEVRDGKRLLVATDGTRSARGDRRGKHAVAVRNGSVLAIGDVSLLKRGNYNVVDNERFIGNVVEFLVDGDRRRTLTDYPYVVADDPTIRYTSPKLLGAAQTVAEDLRATRGQPRLVLSQRSVPTRDTDVLLTTFDTLGTLQVNSGITVSGGTVLVEGGYRSSATGILVIHHPSSDSVDVVIAADTPARVERAAGLLVSQNLDRYATSTSTIVLRTQAADDGEDEADGAGGATSTPGPATP